jgi:hypothetical protein
VARRQRADVDHLAVPADTPQHQGLQLREAPGQLSEARAVAQGAGPAATSIVAPSSTATSARVSCRMAVKARAESVCCRPASGDGP